jgi:Tol biopolymer transport system component
VGVAPDALVALQTGKPHQSLGDIAVMSVDGTHYQQLTKYGYNRDSRLSPDRQRIAYRSVPASIVSSPERDKRLREDNYNLWVITVDGAQAWKLTDSEQPRSIPEWSPDSRKILFSEGIEGVLVEIDVETQVRREIAHGAYSPRYRPGGGVGYITAGGGLAWIDEARTDHVLVPTATLPLSTTVSDFSWLPDGQRIVYILLKQSGAQHQPWAGKSSVEVVTSESGVSSHLFGPMENVRLSSLQVSPDGRLLDAKGGSYGDACAPGSG